METSACKAIKVDEAFQIMIEGIWNSKI